MSIEIENQSREVKPDRGMTEMVSTDVRRHEDGPCDSAVRIQLGCFDQPAAGWINTDITPHIFISRVPLLAPIMHKLGLMSRSRFLQHRRGVFRGVKYVNLAKRLPFKDNSVDAFFSSHTLEHLYVFQTESALREIHRAMKPGAFARFVLPDLERAIQLYRADDPTRFLKFVFEADKPSLSKNQHRWMYTAEYLKRLLLDAGFEHVWLQEYRKTNYEPFIELDNRPENSLYVEARK